MNILILYATRTKVDRKTHNEHLYSFSRYVRGHRFYYLNVLESDALDKRIQSMPFDAVIFHTLLLSQRYDQTGWKQLYKKLKPGFAALSGCKVMLPQDDYNYTSDLWRLATDCKVDHIFSIIPEDQLSVVYPSEKIGHATVSTVLTGYIDEDSLPGIEAMRQTCTRSIDIGYRARKLPYWFGYHGQIKTLVSERFGDTLTHYPDLTCDIANTNAEGAAKALLGDDWMRFLVSCRCMLGCLGGSSILDFDGSIAKCVDQYCALHPEAEYEEVHQACFPNEEDSIRGFMLSPRLFECAMAKTCQLLVEGDYYGIVQPGVDYIEIKRDFSNIDDVLEKVRDHAYCEKIAEQCYEHVVRPGDPDNPYTYRWFANYIVDYIEAHRDNRPKLEMTSEMCAYLEDRCAYYASDDYLYGPKLTKPSYPWYEPFLLAEKFFRYIWTKDGRAKMKAGFLRRVKP